MKNDRPYTPETLEPTVQALWEKLDVFRTPEEGTNNDRRYVLDMFPYPSGDGLHVGHVEGYTATDIYARYLRMQGKHVLHPMGWDAFGLPAENTAIKQKTHPEKLVKKNVDRFRTQLKRLGFSYDWSREINTTDPEYYRWTQWIFLKLFHLGLAYEAVVPINWCPSDKTGLANEEVVDGKCERCGTPVEKKDLRQWMLNITKYAERLARDVEALDWPEGIKELQRNWIGRSEGVDVRFRVTGPSFSDNASSVVTVFTTRVDTLFGVTYLVCAPEHPFIAKCLQENVLTNSDDVRQYVEHATKKSDKERTTLEKEKTGVELQGVRAIHPLIKKEIPVFVADYVLGSYGTGAVMAVPSHDERDALFAEIYHLPVEEVVIQNEHAPETTTAHKLPFTGMGILINSGPFTGQSSVEAQKNITQLLAEEGMGGAAVHYKLRDWVFSRQRYWGEPIPLLHCNTCGIVPVPEEDLPVLLPDVEQYEPTGTGESPLATISSWVHTSCPQCGGSATRETNTMPQWAGSCWYFLRFTDPTNNAFPAAWEALEKWLPVHMYIGGAEHAVLHLLYARFWMKALFDGGYIPFEEPFATLRNQGTILGPDGQKMSKSKGNIVSPDEMIERYGADSLRLYEMFLGPLEQTKPWSTSGMNGVYRFLYRVWNLHTHRTDTVSDEPETAFLVKKVTDDVELLKFNTAIAACMEYLNRAEKNGISPSAYRTFLLLLSPFAPHLAEALWQEHVCSPEEHGTTSIAVAPWPHVDTAALKKSHVRIVVQVNGRVRDTFTVPSGTSQDSLETMARAAKGVQKHLEGKTIQRVVVVPEKLVNIVVAL